MATAVIMPRQGQSVESCIIAKWHKKEGDSVKTGDMLFTYETDKATFEEEARTDGKMLKMFFEEGDDVPCLTNVCVIGADGEDYSQFSPNAEQPAEEEEQKEDLPEEKSEDMVIKQPVFNEGRFKISPRAKRLAERTGADISIALTSGPNGRIIEKDVSDLIAAGSLVSKAASINYVDADKKIEGTGIGGMITTNDLLAVPVLEEIKQEGEFEKVKNTTIRKTIAKAMHASLSNMAQLTLNSSFDATRIIAYRAMIKKNKDTLKLSDITLNDIVLYAVSRVLKNHSGLNAHYNDDEMTIFHSVHLGVAVDTSRGLMVPTIFNADKKSLNQISAEIKILAAQCNEGTINPDFLKGGTFTVTNLGSFGVESFTPVINPPQTAILGVDTIVQKPREINGEIKLFPSMGLSVTFDHRAVDGAPTARFLKDLAISLENFDILLAK